MFYYSFTLKFECAVPGGNSSNKTEPHHEKRCLRGLRPGQTQTGRRSHRSYLES